MVSKYWDPSKVPEHNARITFNFECFSSWSFKNEITQSIVSAEASSQKSKTPPIYSYSGFYGKEQWNIFKSHADAMGWILFELQCKKIIQKIILKAKFRTPELAPRFGGIEIKVGSVYNNDENFSSFSEFGKIPDTMEEQKGILVMIDRSGRPIKGRYILFQRPQGLVIADMKLIGINP